MNYLELCNRVLRRLNEVELTSATFSASLDPPQTAAKDAVNDALHDIYVGELEWPFNHSSVSFSCTSGSGKYLISSISSTIAHFNMDTFYIASAVPDSTVLTKVLPPITLGNWWKNYKEDDENTTSSGYGIPDYVYRTYSEEIGVTPVPDKAYQIHFDGWNKFTELSDYSETPAVPDRYHHIIVDGAMMYMYLYREDFQQSAKQEQKFVKGIQRMRLELIQQPKYFTVK